MFDGGGDGLMSTGDLCFMSCNITNGLWAVNW